MEEPELWLEGVVWGVEPGALRVEAVYWEAFRKAYQGSGRRLMESVERAGGGGE